MGMRFGVCDLTVDPSEQFVRLTRYLEGAGFDHLWVTDSMLHGRDAFAYLAVASQHSTRLRLGTNVVNPLSRHPAVNLTGITTIDDLSGGRAAYGIGLGTTYWLSELGYPPAMRQHVREMVQQTRRLLAGENVTFTGPNFALREARLRYFSQRRQIPIYIAATGPKMLELGGELGDGVFAHVGAHPHTVRFAQERIRAGAERAGRAAEQVDVSLFLFCSISPDRAECLNDCRMAIALIVSRFPGYGDLMGYDPKLVTEIRDTWVGTSSAVTAGRLVPDSWVDDLALIGSPTDVIRKVEALAAIGVTHITILPRGHSEGGRPRMETVRAFGDQVVPKFR